MVGQPQYEPIFPNKRHTKGVPGIDPDAPYNVLDCLTRQQKPAGRAYSRPPIRLTAQQIEASLCVSNSTVKSHTHVVYHKLGIHSRGELAEKVTGMQCDTRG